MKLSPELLGQKALGTYDFQLRPGHVWAAVMARPLRRVTLWEQRSLAEALPTPDYVYPPLLF